MASTSLLGGSGHNVTGLPPIVPNLASSLPQLTSETELQKLLADERMRSQMHKTNYEQLKEEHKRLQDEYAQLEEEIKRTVEESKIVQEKYKTMYEQTRRELGEKSAQMEEIRSSVFTPQRLEIIRTQVTEEISKIYKERYHKQEEEVEEYRTLCNQLKHTLAFTQSEYETQKAEYQRIIEEYKLSAEAEVTNLRKERETTITKVREESSQDTERVRILQKENAQLLLKLKTLTLELEELHAQREKQGFETDNITRVQAKQITELSASVKGLETERESLRRQLDQLQRDLALTGDTHNKLTGQIHELEKENAVYKNKLEELTHKNKVDLTNLKMEMLKQRGELERERDKLLNVVDDLQTKLEINKHTIDQQARALVEKERDAVRRVQAAREEEFVKLTSVESEKLALETKLQEMDRRKIDQEAYKHAEKEKMEERIRAANDAKETAERELLVLKSKIDHQNSLQNQIERERSENSDLKSKISKLETEINAYLGNEHDMTDDNLRLRNQVELLREEIKLTKGQLKKVQDNHDIILMQQKSAFTEEKAQIDHRLQELQGQLKELHGKYQRALTAYKKYKKKSTHVVERLKDKIEILEAKNVEIELEKKALQACVPQDIYSKLKKQWKDLHRRHNEFRKVLLSSVFPVTIGDMSFANVTVPVDCTFLPGNVSFTEQERKHQEDLRLLKQRLDRVDNNQQKQLEELQEIASSTFRGTFPELDEKIGERVIEEKITESEVIIEHEKIVTKDVIVEDESMEKADSEKSS
ncbi:centrosomal protein of 83 kDa-like [Saccostrea echinata]|uniref:centrosomal protein of 83 kDa-like n=1 Tax=Saccostrea echinata TaxID=191078 RepID=UPI002A8307BD|nr:centrosomal protein of 83 kDa-like [Saccostrea echinata]